MQSLQDLYDYYLTTIPSPGKLKTASSMLIHVCKILNLNSAEEVTEDYYKEIPAAIERYHHTSTNLAVQEKSVLAEMIGHYGPKEGWEKTFDILLSDADENLRQFALNALEYQIERDPDRVLTYIGQFKNSNDDSLRDTAIHLICVFLCSSRQKKIKSLLLDWLKDEPVSFYDSLLFQLQKCASSRFNSGRKDECQAAYNWLLETFKANSHK